MKRKVLTGLAALTLFDIAAAHAQPPVPTWTGYYVGANAGFEWANVNGAFPFGGFPVFPGPTFPVMSSVYSLNPTSGLLGFQGGYNFQVNPNWLVGVEADFDWGHGNASTSFNLFDPITNSTGSAQFSTSIDWSTSLRGRVGYTTGPWLLYATGGLSLLRMNVSGSGAYNGALTVCTDFFDGFCTTTASSATNSAWAFSGSRILPGLVIGPGVEYMLPGGKWTLRAQYLFADYGRVNFGPAAIVSSYTDTGIMCTCTVSSTSYGNVSARVTTQTVTVGVNFKIP